MCICFPQTYLILNRLHSLTSVIGHSIDIQIECSSEETTAVQDDSAAGSSDPNGHFCAPSEYSEDYTDFTAAVNFPVVKEEPPSRDSVYIKFEVKEENPCTDQDDDSSPSCLLEREPLENYHFHHHRDSTFGTRTISAFGTRSIPSYYSSGPFDRRLSSVSSFKSIFFFYSCKGEGLYLVFVRHDKCDNLRSVCLFV